MAEKKTGTSFQSIMADLKAGKYAPIYILMGEESYYIDRVAEYIEQHVLQQEERDFNQTILFGADTNAAQIADLCKGYPMMASHRVIIVKEAQNLRNFDNIDKYLDKPVNTTILVLCHKNGSIDKRKKIVAKAQAVGVVLECKKLYDRELPGFIETYLRSKQATIEKKAAQMVADHIGADLSRLTSELDKLLISLPETDHRVTPETVEKEIGVSKDFNPFELKNAIIRKDVLKANQIIKYFDNNPKAGNIFQMLPTLFSYFQNLMIAYYCPNRNNTEALAKYLDLRQVWTVNDYVTGMRNYSGMKVMQIIGKMREIDAKSKGLDNGSTEAGELMKELVFFILH